MKNDLEKILVAVDCGAPSHQALSRAAWLASNANAELEAVHVATTLTGACADLQGERVAPGRDARRAASLHVAALRAGATFGIPINVRVAQGKPHVAIAERAAAIGADLVVLGAHREASLRDLFRESTAERVQRQLRVPLLIVRNQGVRNYDHVLIGIDFSAASAEAGRMAAKLFPSARLVYLHVSVIPFEGRLAMADVTKEGMLGYRNQVLADVSRRLDLFLREEGLLADRSRALVRAGYPAAGIKQTAAELGISLVALGSRRKSRLGTALLGSVSEQFVNPRLYDVLLVSPDRKGVVSDARDLPVGSATCIAVSET